MIGVAPGKLMLAGEYAVLHGGPAWVMAVDRVARVGVATDAHPPRSLPEVDATFAVAVERGLLRGPTPGDALGFDLAALQERDGRKLGLGSSAAGCVAALAWAMAREGHDVAARREDIARCARDGHRRAQGGGSGVDVLASAMGSVLAVQFPDGLDGAPAMRRVAWPDALRWTVLWSGTPARTWNMLAAVRALESSEPARHARLQGAIADAAGAFGAALDAGSTGDALAAVRRHLGAMESLGAHAGVPVVTDELRRLADAIEPLGAAVKPSGAGGGDVSLVFASRDDTLAEVHRVAGAFGFAPVTLSRDDFGARVIEGTLP